MSNTPGSSDELIVLQTLRCIGHSGPGRVATASGLGDDLTGFLLQRLRGQGHVTLDDGPFGGWSLTLAGRGWVESLVEEELEAGGTGPDVLDTYRAFLPLNRRAMEVFHAWQMWEIAGTRAVNDHTDPEYDDEVLTRLSSIDEEAQELLARLAEKISRFAAYGPRLSSALAGARAGQVSLVADDLESYHSIWFQLHEDLLTTCGISREEERRGL